MKGLLINVAKIDAGMLALNNIEKMIDKGICAIGVINAKNTPIATPLDMLLLLNENKELCLTCFPKKIETYYLLHFYILLIFF